jgi:hypothetical protein
MSSISPLGQLPQISDPNIEQSAETPQSEHASHHPQDSGYGSGYDSESNSSNSISQALAEWGGQDMPVGLTEGTQGTQGAQSAANAQSGRDGGEKRLENRGQEGNRGMERGQSYGGNRGMERGQSYGGNRGMGRQGSSIQSNPSSSKPTATNASGSAATSASGSAATSASGSAATSGSSDLGSPVPAALQPYVQYINAASAQTGVPASLIGAQILQESGGDPNAVTTNPALGLADTGLMQVDSATFQGLQQQYPSLLAGKSVSDPATNIMAGSLYIAQLLQQNNGDTSGALTSYNGGADPNYVNEVTSKMTALQNGTPVPGGFS